MRHLYSFAGDRSRNDYLPMLIITRHGMQQDTNCDYYLYSTAVRGRTGTGGTDCALGWSPRPVPRELTDLGTEPSKVPQAPDTEHLENLGAPTLELGPATI